MCKICSQKKKNQNNSESSDEDCQFSLEANHIKLKSELNGTPNARNVKQKHLLPLLTPGSDFSEVSIRKLHQRVSEIEDMVPSRRVRLKSTTS